MSNKHQHREIAVDADGELLTLVDGTLRGNPELVKAVRRNSILREPVRLSQPHGRHFEANLEGDAFAATAALMSAKLNRSRVLKAPPEVMEYLNGSEEIPYPSDSPQSGEKSI